MVANRQSTGTDGLEGADALSAGGANAPFPFVVLERDAEVVGGAGGDQEAFTISIFAAHAQRTTSLGKTAREALVAALAVEVFEPKSGAAANNVLSSYGVTQPPIAPPPVVAPPVQAPAPKAPRALERREPMASPAPVVATPPPAAKAAPASEMRMVPPPPPPSLDKPRVSLRRPSGSVETMPPLDAPLLPIMEMGGLPAVKAAPARDVGAPVVTRPSFSPAQSPAVSNQRTVATAPSTPAPLIPLSASFPPMAATVVKAAPKPTKPKGPGIALPVAFVLLGVGVAGWAVYSLQRSGRIGAWIEQTVGASGQVESKKEDPAEAKTLTKPPVNPPRVEPRPKVSAGRPEDVPGKATTAGSPGEPSEAFTRIVSEFRVTGVLQGNPVRALIDGRKVQIGDLVDADLGIRLIKADFANRRLIFEDRTKAQASVRY